MSERRPRKQIDAITIRLDGKPVAKGRPRIGRGGGGRPMAFTPAHTRKYEAVLRLAAQEQMNGRAPLEGPLRVTVTAWLGVPTSWSKKKTASALAGIVRPTKRPDIDNYAKAALDALNTIVFADDSQITELNVSKLYDRRPGLCISVKRITEAEAA